MFRYLVFPASDGWRVRLEDDDQSLRFDTLQSAERRARWLSMRATVQGAESEILLLDDAGTMVGRWRGERYESLRLLTVVAA
jgi:hypothetical protein